MSAEKELEYVSLATTVAVLPVSPFTDVVYVTGADANHSITSISGRGFREGQTLVVRKDPTAANDIVLTDTAVTMLTTGNRTVSDDDSIILQFLGGNSWAEISFTNV